MRIAAIADVHLGFRRYTALTAMGRNQREADVSEAWAAAVARMIERDVDLCLIAGDLYDSGRCSVLAMADGMRGIKRLVAAGIPVVIAAGNHDVKGSAVNGASGAEYHGSPLLLCSLAGAKVVAKAERVTIKSLNAHVLVVPDSDAGKVHLEPSTAAGTHLLCAHGKFSASLYRLPESQCVDPATISPDFAYAALGDFHVASQVTANAHYSGATEWTSSNVWGELSGAPKGWTLYDTETRTLERVTVPTRPHFDLPPFSAHGMTAQDVTARVCDQLAAVPLEGAVVRQVIHDFLRSEQRAMDHKALKAASAAALTFQLDTRAVDALAARGIVKPLEDAPDWIDAMNAEDDIVLPQADDYSYADAVQRGEMPLLPTDADPYGVDTPAARTAAA